jgi:glycerol-3-phosphate dehydrogenase (NAD(P)+)
MTDDVKRVEQIIVFGAGAFGRALAASAREAGHQVTLLAPTDRDLAPARSSQRLSGCVFQSMDGVCGAWGKGFKNPLILMVVPCQALRSACGWLRDHWGDSEPLDVLSASKGVEQGTLALPHQVMEQMLPVGSRVAVLSGPSFARELEAGMMTAVVCASKASGLVQRASELLHRPHFRVYASDDVIGVEVGGALKNVVAMVAGAVDGLKMGENARAAVITRGLGEITQVGVALGADPITFLGLSGIGDLVLTCTGNQSRNRTFGMRMAEGADPQVIMADLGQVVEGYATARSAFDLSAKLQLDTPIIRAVYGVLYEGLSLPKALENLMSRDQKPEFGWAKG